MPSSSICLITRWRHPATRAPVRVLVRHEALSVVVDIIDEGPGMTPEFIRDELFRPFATTKGGGHGIGAYQARELLRRAGGDLLVLSRKPGGTTMRLLLPAVRLTVADCRDVCRPEDRHGRQAKAAGRRG